MDVAGFYAIMSGICFALCGLWWTVLENRREWTRNPTLRRLAGGVYASFLIPGAMALGAQIGGENTLVWRAVFVIAALAGMVYTFRLLSAMRSMQQPGWMARNRWLVAFLYAVVLVVGAIPQLVAFTGLKPIQIEAFLLSIIILLGHGLAWELMTGNPG